MDKRYNLLGVSVSVTDVDRAYQTITRWIDRRDKQYICVCPVSTIVDCQKDERYKTIVNHAGMVTPDGMPVMWMGRLKGHPDIRRTYGPDLMRTVCRLGQERGIKHFFYGGTEETNARLVEQLKTEYPAIQIAGSYAPPFLACGELEKEVVLERIRQVRPDILWIGLGSPKQDYWMANHRERLDVPVLVGVGAAFDFLAGVKPQAPPWMQKSGLEWLFRLGSEPRRLWKRYLFGNTVFVFLILKESFLALFKSHD